MPPRRLPRAKERSGHSDLLGALAAGVTSLAHAVSRAPGGLAHALAAGNAAQVRREAERDSAYNMQGGPGGSRMSYTEARKIVKQANSKNMQRRRH